MKILLTTKANQLLSLNYLEVSIAMIYIAEIDTSDITKMTTIITKMTTKDQNILYVMLYVQQLVILATVDELESDQLPDIESMWDGWKCNTNGRLRPVVQYSQKLKVCMSYNYISYLHKSKIFSF